MMGISVSRPIQSSRFVNLLVELPQITDDLDPKDLRSMCLVSKEVRTAVDHPAVWRCQFAKAVGTRPSTLPAPGMYTFGSNNPFKLLCQGLHTARYMAQALNHADGPSVSTSRSLTSVYGYLREFYPESSAILSRLVDELERLESQNMLPDNFWQEMATAGGLTVLGSGGVAVSAYGMYLVPTHVISPPTVKIAKLVHTMGAKWASVYLYSIYGLTAINGALGVGIGVYCTVDTLTRARQYNVARKERMRDLRIRDLVAERRRV